jgi:hypothetical protein
MRWIRRALFGYAASWAWRNRDRIKQNVSGMLDGTPQARTGTAASRS